LGKILRSSLKTIPYSIASITILSLLPISVLNSLYVRGITWYPGGTSTFFNLSEDKVYKSLKRGIKLPRVELHTLPKKELGAYKTSRWMWTIEEEGIKIL